MDESEYDGTERRSIRRISDQDIERVAQRTADIIAERGIVAEQAANKIKNEFFAEFGRAIAKRVLYMVGTGGSAIGLWEIFKALKP